METGDFVEDDPQPDDLLYDAWCLIANAPGGWGEGAVSTWQAAAERWRDRWHETLDQEAVMPVQAVPASIFGRERAVLDNIVKALDDGLRHPLETTKRSETRRGSTFDIRKVIDGDEFIARVTVELLPREATATGGPTDV